MERIGNYTFVSEIGGGNFGKVFKVVDDQGQFFAVKKIQTRGMNQKLRSLIENEKMILQQINHKSVLKFIGMFESAHYVYILTELCEGGDLENYMKNHGTVGYETGRRWIRDLADALQTLKTQGILHRDFKVANLLLTDKDPENADIKICDFGFSKFLTNSITCTQLGTPLYMAPEIFTSPTYNYKIDIWSLGVVAYEILCGSPPFKCYNLEELKKQQKKPVEFEDNPSLPEPAKDFIRKLLTFDPNQRPDYATLLNHEFLQVKQEVVEEIKVNEEGEYDFCDDLSEKVTENVENNKEETKSEENIKESLSEFEEIEEKAQEIIENSEKVEEIQGKVEEIQEKIVESIVKVEENKEKIQEKPEVSVLPVHNIGSHAKKEENPLGRQSILLYLQKEVQVLAMETEKQLGDLNKYEKLTADYKNNKEISYFLHLYRQKRELEILQTLEDARNSQLNVEELAKLLDEKFIKLQLNLISLNEEIEKIKATNKFNEDDIRIKIITEGYDLIEDRKNALKVQMLFNAAFYMYPGDEVIFEFLSQCSS